MKKYLAVGVAVLMAVSAAVAQNVNADFNVVRARSIHLYGNEPLKIGGTAVTATASQLNAAGAGSSADITPTTATVSGKTTANGELEANADVDINFGSATEEMTIDQTNVAGTATVPLIAITDARTGDTANTAAEATLVITAEGTHAVSVAKGITALKAVTATEITTLTTPLSVANGGSGAATFTDGGILLGSGTDAITALGVASNGQIPIGDGTTDPVLATITATTGETTVANGAGTITIGLDDPIAASKVALATFDITGFTNGTLTVAQGGTGVATLTGVAKGNGTSVMSAAVAGTDYIAPGSTFNAAAAAFDVSGFTNGTLAAARVPFAAFDVSGFTNGVLAAARVPFAAYDISGFTNGVLAGANGGAGTASGILKANGSGTVSAASAGSDYAAAFTGITVTNTMIWLDGGTNPVTNVWTYANGILTAWTTNGTSVVP